MKQTTSRRRQIALAAVAVALVLGAGFAIGAEIFGTSSGPVHHDAPNGPEITTIDADYEVDVPIQDGLVDLGHTRFASSGPASANASNFDSEFIELTDINASNYELAVDSHRPILGIQGNATRVAWRNYKADSGVTAIEVETPDNLSLRLTDLPRDSWVRLMEDDVLGTSAAWTGGNGMATIHPVSANSYTIESYDESDIFSNPNPAGGETIEPNEQGYVTLSVDFDPPDGETRWVRFWDADTGEFLGGGEFNQPRTVDTRWYLDSGGRKRWYVTYGDNNETQSQIYEFGTPGIVEIRDEQTQELLNGSDIDVDVAYFDGGDTAYQRTVSDGRADLSGLPPDTPFVVSASNVSGYHDRRIYIEDITKPETIYLLDTSASTVDIEFLLEDLTGNFGGDETRLIVERAFETNTSGTTTELEYRQLLGDLFGAADGFSVTLQEAKRYRLRVAADTRARSLGHYQPERSEAITLTIGELNWQLPRSIEGQITWDAEGITRDGDEMIRLKINDSLSKLENVSVHIYETTNESNVLLNDTFPGPYGELVVTQTIPSSQANVSSWTVEWEGDYNSTLSAKTVIGQGQYAIGVPAPDGIMGIFSALLITFTAGFFSVRVSELGLVIVPLVALGLFAAGWLPLPLPWILASLAIGVMTEFATRGGFDRR
jgi:hypothetical protein